MSGYGQHGKSATAAPAVTADQATAAWQQYYQQLSLQQHQAALYAASMAGQAQAQAQAQFAQPAAFPFGYGPAQGAYGMMGAPGAVPQPQMQVPMQMPAPQMPPASYGRPAQPAYPPPAPGQASAPPAAAGWQGFGQAPPNFSGQAAPGYGTQQAQGYARGGHAGGRGRGGGGGPPRVGGPGQPQFGPRNDRGPTGPSHGYSGRGGRGGGHGNYDRPYDRPNDRYDRNDRNDRAGQGPGGPPRSQGPPYTGSSNAIPPNLDPSSPAFSSRSYADLVFPPSPPRQGEGKAAESAARDNQAPNYDRPKSPPLPRGPYINRGRGGYGAPPPRDHWRDRDSHGPPRSDYGPPAKRMRMNDGYPPPRFGPGGPRPHGPSGPGFGRGGYGGPRGGGGGRGGRGGGGYYGPRAGGQGGPPSAPKATEPGEKALSTGEDAPPQPSQQQLATSGGAQGQAGDEGQKQPERPRRERGERGGRRKAEKIAKAQAALAARAGEKFDAKRYYRKSFLADPWATLENPPSRQDQTQEEASGEHVIVDQSAEAGVERRFSVAASEHEGTGGGADDGRTGAAQMREDDDAQMDVETGDGESGEPVSFFDTAEVLAPEGETGTEREQAEGGESGKNAGPAVPHARAGAQTEQPGE